MSGKYNLFGLIEKLGFLYIDIDFYSLLTLTHHLQCVQI